MTCSKELTYALKVLQTILINRFCSVVEMFREASFKLPSTLLSFVILQIIIRCDITILTRNPFVEAYKSTTVNSVFESFAS